MLTEIRQEIQDTYKFRHVVVNFVRSTLKLRYQRTILGFFWSILGPMLHYLVVGMVFSYVMKSSIPNYAAYMFAGALYFNVISGVVTRSPGILLANEHFIKKIYIPKLVFIMDAVLVELTNFFLGFCALLILALLFRRIDFSIHYAVVPFSLLLVAMLTIGLASIISVAGVYFRDLSHIVPVVMQAGFFLTPVVYDLSIMPEKFRALILFNPLYYFIEIFRRPIVYNEWPPLSYAILAGGISCAALGIGLLTLKYHDNKIVFRL